eukprot:1093800-Rhodomonas_salina.1
MEDEGEIVKVETAKSIAISRLFRTVCTRSEADKPLISPRNLRPGVAMVSRCAVAMLCPEEDADVETPPPMGDPNKEVSE